MSHDRPSICTASGIEFYPFDPRPADIRIADIAHHLAARARFSGATRVPYSVAQHCVLGCDLLRARGASALAMRTFHLHDAAEAFFPDLPSTIKRRPEFAALVRAENRLQDAIYARFSLALPAGSDVAEVVHTCDRAMCAAERRDLMPACDWWPVESKPDVPLITPWSFHDARDRFLWRAHELGISDE